MTLQMSLLAEPGYSVTPIPPAHTHWLLLNVHYARRVPPISHAFGLYDGPDLAGVVTYGVPASRSLCVGVAGEQYVDSVLELNRLVLVNNEPNEASRLIGASLKQLRGPNVVVSYADTAQDHVGKVYQATNWLYTGLSDAHVEWRLDGAPTATHDRHLFDDVGGIEEAKRLYGDRLKRHERSRKHRYIQLVGDRTQKRAMRQALIYEVQPYPKAEHVR